MKVSDVCIDVPKFPPCPTRKYTCNTARIEVSNIAPTRTEKVFYDSHKHVVFFQVAAFISKKEQYPKELYTSNIGGPRRTGGPGGLVTPHHGDRTSMIGCP